MDIFKFILSNSIDIIDKTSSQEISLLHIIIFCIMRLIKCQIVDISPISLVESISFTFGQLKPIFGIMFFSYESIREVFKCDALHWNEAQYRYDQGKLL